MANKKISKAEITLKIKLKKLKTEEKRVKNNISSNKEYQKLNRQLKIIRAKRDESNREGDNIKKEINNKFLDYSDSGNMSPSYSRGGTYGYEIETNIKEEVLEAIKKQVGGLSYLKIKDIEKIVEKLIEKEKDKNQRLKFLIEEYDKLDKGVDIIETGIEKMKKEKYLINSQIYDIENKLTDMIDRRLNKKEYLKLKHSDKIYNKKEKLRKEALEKIDDIYQTHQKILMLENLKENGED